MKVKVVLYPILDHPYSFTHLIFCLVTFFSLSPSLAQDQSKIDSLQEVFKQTKSDTVKIMALKDIAWQYYFTRPDTFRDYADSVINFSERTNYTRGKWKGYSMVGVLYFGESEYDSAKMWLARALSLSDDKKFDPDRIYSLTYLGHSYVNTAIFDKADSCFNKLLTISTSLGNNYEIGRAHKALGINAYTEGNYYSALNHYLEADSLFNQEISIDQAENLQNIGIVYHILENTRAEKFYFSEAMTSYEKMDDKYGVNAVYISLGKTENNARNYENGKEYFAKAISYFKDINDPLMLGEALYGIAESYKHLGDYTNAINYYNDGLTKLENTEGATTLTQLYRGLGEVYMVKNDLNKAQSYLQNAYLAAEKTSRVEDVVAVLESQANLYSNKMDFENAFTTQKTLQVLADSVSKMQRSKVLHELDAKYQTEKKEQRIELLTTQNQLAEQERHNQLYILIAVIVLVLMIAIFFYSLYRNHQKTTRKLQELDKVKSDFFANISHEFRTPLTLIKGPVSDQLAKEGIEEKDKENLELINTNADRLLSLVDQLLDLSKIESGGVRLQVQKSSLNQFVSGLVSSFVYAATEKSQSLHINVPETVDTSWYDKDVFQKVIVNLLSNAIKYTPENGEIDFELELLNDTARIKVRNTGKGIKKEEVDKVFVRFYQANDMRDGVGIGLALVKELVTLHKGTIVLNSQENEWTELMVAIPVNNESYSTGEILNLTSVDNDYSKLPTADISDLEDSVKGIDINGLPILLIVEDHRDLRKMIREMFEDSFIVIEAEDGMMGVEKATGHVPDIIISDVMMPNKNGVEMCAELKTDERTSHIPIILLTAKAGEENELAGLETGADDYMVKPFNKNILRVRVQKLIELRSQLRERYSQEVVLRPKDIAVNSADEKFLSRLQILIDEKFTEPDFNAETFSHEMGMSRMQLHRKLKALVGLTTSEFIRSQRLKMAATLLKKAGINMSEVGYEVGFNDPSYFAKCFKEMYKCTPKEYARPTGKQVT